MNGILAVHSHHQDAELGFCRILVPSDASTKERIMPELHSTPRNANSGIQRTLGKMRRSFLWKGIMGDVSSFLERCPTCQMEKSDHTLSKDKLQFTQILETKWNKLSIDFMTDLPKSPRNHDSILVVADKATKMVHMVPCCKGRTTTNTTRLLWNTMVKLHGVSMAIYSDRGIQFTAESWRELWRLIVTKLAYSIAYHPQTQGCLNECTQ